MHSLDSTFASLKELLLQPDTLNPTRGDPYFYFVHSPEQTLQIKQRIPMWSSALKQDGGWDVQVVSLADLIWQTVDSTGWWEEWLRNESQAKPAAVRRSVESALIEQGRLVNRVRELVSSDASGRLLFLMDAAALHPFFRVRALEESLHNVIRMPTVLFYPGRRIGQFGLRFLDCYDEDNNYRSTLVGG